MISIYNGSRVISRTVFDLDNYDDTGIGDEDVVEDDHDDDDDDDDDARSAAPRTRRKVSRQQKATSLATPRLSVPYNIRFDVMVGGASKSIMMSDQCTWLLFLEEIANVLRIPTTNLQLVYEVPWKISGCKPPARHLDSRDELQSLFEDVRAYVMREMQKKKNSGTIPPFSIMIKDVSTVQQTGARVRQNHRAHSRLLTFCHRKTPKMPPS